jgi:hypothetical protein
MKALRMRMSGRSGSMGNSPGQSRNGSGPRLLIWGSGEHGGVLASNNAQPGYGENIERQPIYTSVDL